MLIGIKKLFFSDCGISITGFAGPQQSKLDLVGLVFIGTFLKEKTIVQKYQFSGNREAVRKKAIISALMQLYSLCLQT